MHSQYSVSSVGSENICGIFTLHLDLLTCRLRESEMAGRRNTDLLIHDDFATV